MRKVVAYELLSLDGVAESPDKFIFDFDEVMYENLARVIGGQDAVLLGRRMYDDWAAYWPTGDDELFASFINDVAKYVATSSPLTIEWDRASKIDGRVEDFVRELKAQPGSDIGIHGSISLVQSLLQAGVVDELSLVVAPVAAGTGRRLFSEAAGVQKFELARATTTPSGALLLDYRVVRSNDG